MPRPKPLHDPQVLRAIAHPVRNRILAELDAHGSLRAADLARDLDIPANQASFHLRQLAKYGLIVEDPDAARDKRDRVWRVVNPEGFSVEMGEIERQPGGKAAAADLPSEPAGLGPPGRRHGVLRHARQGHPEHPDRLRAAADQGGGLRAVPGDRRAGQALGGPDPRGRRGPHHLPLLRRDPCPTRRRRWPTDGGPAPAGRPRRRGRGPGPGARRRRPTAPTSGCSPSTTSPCSRSARPATRSRSASRRTPPCR